MQAIVNAAAKEDEFVKQSIITRLDPEFGVLVRLTLEQLFTYLYFFRCERKVIATVKCFILRLPPVLHALVKLLTRYLIEEHSIDVVLLWLEVLQELRQLDNITIPVFAHFFSLIIIKTWPNLSHAAHQPDATFTFFIAMEFRLW